ncbi:hypothetical protein [Dokdonella sp.]|uniref:hypothetical protein n=1 Tax=Dokdonella sp. TaxID=2291710 RepID=UPI00378419B2
MFHAGFYRLKSRHPLARLAALVLAVMAVVVLLAIGVFAIAVLALGGMVFALMRALRAPRAATTGHAATATRDTQGVIEGEFRVVDHDAHGHATHS